VVPYPKPLSLSAWSAAALGLDARSGDSALLVAAELGAALLPTGRALTDIVFPELGADAPSMERVPASEGLARLLTQSFNHYRDGLRAFELTTELFRTARAWRLRCAAPHESTAFLINTLEKRAGQPTAGP
jgi:hypothetical protein